MDLVKWIKELLDCIPKKREIDYFRKTGNIPMCGCDSFLEADDCRHIRKIRREVNKKFNLELKGKSIKKK